VVYTVVANTAICTVQIIIIIITIIKNDKLQIRHYIIWLLLPEVLTLCGSSVDVREDINRAVFTHGPKGPEPRAANFQGRRIKKKSRLK
jgi:hypothetical protein